MSEPQDPRNVWSVLFIPELMAEKDAEIEQLKAENNSLRLDAVEYRRLITELCDALGLCDPGWPEYHKELIARAREATR